MHVERKMKNNKKTSPLLLSALRNLSAFAIYDLSDTEILIVFILFNALVVRLSIKPILFLLVSNGNANIANIVFL